MKKFYTLLALVLAMLCTVTVDAQKYRLSEEAALPETGKTYAIMNAGTNTFMSCKYGPSGGLLSILEDDDCLWQIEATGEKTAGGYDLYYLYSVGQQKYLQEVDLEGNPGLDGYDVFAYNGCNFELGDKANAAKVTIEKGSPLDSDNSGKEDESWRANGPSTGFVIAREASPLIWPDESERFFKFGVQNVNFAWEPYNEEVAWQFWTVEGLSAKEELEALVDNYSKTEFIGGNDPGFYEEAKVEAYNSSLESAMLLVITSSDEAELQAAVDDLRAKREAVEKAVINITPGYYYMVNAFDDHLNNFGVEKAAYGNANTGTLFYRTFDADNVDFVFYVEKGPDADEYWVQDYSTSLYVAKGTVWYNSTPFMTPDKAEPQNIRLYAPGKWYWGSRTFHNTSYTPYAVSYPATAADKEGALTTWGQWADDVTKLQGTNLWYMRKVPADKMKEFVTQKEQSNRTQTIEKLATEGSKLYANLFTYTPDFENPLITQAGGGYGADPEEGDQLYFSTIRRQGIASADQYKFLIDKDSVSYMQGAGYIQVDLSKTPSQIITIEYNNRMGSDKQIQWGKQERPNNVDLYASNKPGNHLEGEEADPGEWVKIGNFDMGALPVPARYTIDLGAEYSHIRYQVNTNANAGTYFTISEFQVYPAKIDQTTSQYYTTEGLAAKADVMKQTIAAKLETAAEATEADIDELRQAIAAVSELYADTLVLSKLVDDCTILATTVTVGEGIGQSNDETAAATLKAAVETAKPFINPAVSVADLKKAIADLQAAKDAFMATIKQFEPNKFYYLVNASEGEYAGAPMKTSLPTTTLTSGTNAIRADLTGEDYTSSANHMYTFVPTERGTYYVQNLATGFYLPSFDTAEGVITASRSAAEYKVEYTGFGGYTLTAANALNSNEYALGILKGDTISHMERGATSSWTIVELDEEIEAIISTRFSYNTQGVMALPYNLASMDINENFHMYGIKKMTQTTAENGTITTEIEFYEKETAEAGEPVFYVWGTVGTAEDVVPMELMTAMPTEVVDIKTPANGLVGTLYSQAMGAGVAYFTGTETKVTTTSTNIFYQLGVIDPTYYTGEVEGAETAFTMTIDGLNAIPAPSTPGDVNEDGSVNAADVVAIYNYIADGAESGVSEALADVNADGTVSAADVVKIYSIISGDAANSKGFVEAIVEDGDNQVARLSAAIGNSDDLTAVPVTVFLNNSIDIVAAEYVVVAPVAPAKFVYDEEEEDYMIANTDRWSKGHNAVMIPGTALHGQDGFFVSITDSKNRAFAGSEGSIATVYFDATGLADGDYEVTVKDGIAVTKATDTYKTADMTLKFVIAGGKATGLSTITAEQIAAAKSITTIDGQAVATPVKGNIYVVDGAVIKY